MNWKLLLPSLAVLPLFIAGCTQPEPAPSAAPGPTDVPKFQHPGEPGAERINAGGWVDSPFLTLDGKELYFMHAPLDFWKFRMEQPPRYEKHGPIRPGHTTGAASDWDLVNTDLYVSRLVNGTWTKPVALTELNTPTAQECCPFVTRDSKRIYFLRGELRKEGAVPEIFVADRTSDGRWEKVRKFEGDLSPLKNVGNSHLSQDGREFYVDAMQPGTTDEEKIDIYVLRWADGGWGRPERIPAINSPHRDAAPWLSPDGKRLYFTRLEEVPNISICGKLLMSERNPATGEWQAPRELKTNLPNAIFGCPIFEEPSLTADERTMAIATLVQERRTQEIWMGSLMGDAWVFKPVDEAR